MAGVIIFNALMVVLGAAVASPIVPMKLLGPVLSGLHDTIGITMPPPDKLRMYALIWLASVRVCVPLNRARSWEVTETRRGLR